jgi:hypothetical protein
MMPLFFMAALAQAKPEKAELKIEKRSVLEALAVVKTEVRGWSAEAVFLRATCTSAVKEDCDPFAGRYTQVELLFATKESCPPGELRTRAWKFGATEPPLSAAEQRTEKSGGGSLPDRFVDSKAAFLAMREAGMAHFPPALELSVVYGRPLWYSIDPGKHWFVDARTGEFLSFADAEILAYTREQTNAVTSWKQALEVVERELRGWKADKAQLGSIRGLGLNRRHFDLDLGLTTWEFSVSSGGAAPTMLFFRVANGGLAYWAIDAAPRDQGHFAALGSWSLGGAGQVIAANAATREFLGFQPAVSGELVIDAPRMKSGQALYRLRNAETGAVLEITLDRKGAIQGIKK